MSGNTLPGCIGYYLKPIAPNNCHSCAWAGLCSKVVAKQRLQLLVAKISEVKRILRGEINER